MLHAKPDAKGNPLKLTWSIAPGVLGVAAGLLAGLLLGRLLSRRASRRAAP